MSPPKAEQQGKRLQHAREYAGYKSAREAALQNSWKESTYRAHESGTRTMGVDDADKYAARFRALGVSITGQEILYGGGATAIVAEDFVPLSDVRDALVAIVGKLDISDIAAEILVQTILQRLKDRRSPPVGVSRSAAVRTFVHDKVDEFSEQPPNNIHPKHP